MSQNHSTVIYLLVTYFNLNYHQKWSYTSWGVIQDLACSHMTEAGGSCPRSRSGLPVWGHCTPPLKELSQKQSAGVSSSRAPVSPHSIQQRPKGELAVREKGFLSHAGAPKNSQQLSQSSGVLWMSLSLLPAQGWVCVAPSEMSLGQPVPICLPGALPQSCSRRAGAVTAVTGCSALWLRALHSGCISPPRHWCVTAED